MYKGKENIVMQDLVTDDKSMPTFDTTVMVLQRSEYTLTSDVSLVIGSRRCLPCSNKSQDGDTLRLLLCCRQRYDIAEEVSGGPSDNESGAVPVDDDVGFLLKHNKNKMGKPERKQKSQR